MKKIAVWKQASMWIVLSVLWVCACGFPEEENWDYTHISLFCDVDFWTPPKWDTAENTITGKITKETDVALEINVPPQDANNQLRLMLVNDTLPDLITVTDATTISQLASSGKFWDLEEFFQKYLPDTHIFQDFPEDVKEGLVKRDGGWYAYPSHLAIGEITQIWKPSSPCYQDMVEYASNSGIIWNKELLKELEVDPEELRTEQQILQVFEKAVRKNQDRVEPIIPIMLDGQNYQDHSLTFFLETFGAESVDAQGDYIDRILQPEAKDALFFLNQLVQNGYFRTQWLTLSNAKIRKLIAGGNVLAFVGNTANINMVPQDWVSSGPILSSTGKHPVYGREQEVGLGWMNTFISKTCEHPKELAKWLDYMTSKEGMLLWDFGDEGTHYKLDDGLVKLTEEGKEARRDYGNSGVAVWWMFHNTAWQRSILAPYEEGSEEEAETQIKVAYGKAKRTKQYDSSLLHMSLDEEAQNLDTALKECEKRQILKVILAKNNEQFEKEYQIMMDKLAELGIYSLDEKKNEQYQKNCQRAYHKIQKVN